jgi:hypothetical protein
MFGRAKVAVAPAEARNNELVQFLGIGLLIIACGIAVYLGGGRAYNDGTSSSNTFSQLVLPDRAG